MQVIPGIGAGFDGRYEAICTYAGRATNGLSVSTNTVWASGKIVFAEAKALTGNQTEAHPMDYEMSAPIGLSIFVGALKPEDLLGIIGLTNSI